ncbi:MAG: YebC/PmpR family DNA-binding transcriptional regulator [Bacteroidales bacterium]|jgi:YebC/PmpR family DNA-binding regulatory protein|nr:YebC/PmpR family DNA-binding transcriptional regulator [Bacteroidales bacterium]MCK9498792.1 YebC/PmpR family DNA-binding transcriptional regulator [Bacteroidales bacterium]MDY0315795.1 YebC/PmpR family DNA-binding transcriptional regulator [Bacteroidales bacterium]NLB86571.1 YebC/PmpR family DNA-binding transcriptional regulator [Bacteroidales bacterium]
MAGHSKWSTIKRKKGALDAKRSKMFSKFSKEITIAVKEGGGHDPDYNSRLRIAIQNAKGVNMPKDNIERAIKRGDQDGASFQAVSFEGYAAHGIAIFIECLTDNNNRTVSSVRSAFNKFNGTLGTNGSLSFLFDRKGVFDFAKPENMDFDEIEMELIDAGAEEIEVEEENVNVICSIEDFGSLSKKLEELKIEVESAELQRIPNDTKTLNLNEAKSVLKLIDVLEDDDDVQNVFHNMEMTDEIIEAME